MTSRCRNRFKSWFWMLVIISGLIVSAPIKAGAANGSVTYTYDALGRVISATYDTGVTIAYSYDANGNRTQQTIGLLGPLTWTATSTPCMANCWGTSLWQ